VGRTEGHRYPWMGASSIRDIWRVELVIRGVDINGCVFCRMLN